MKHAPAASAPPAPPRVALPRAARRLVAAEVAAFIAYLQAVRDHSQGRPTGAPLDATSVAAVNAARDAWFAQGRALRKFILAVADGIERGAPAPASPPVPGTPVP